MRIAHCSDLHAVRVPEWRQANVKRLLAAANQALFRRRRHRERLAAEAVSALAAKRPDIVLFTGDFTQHGLPKEATAAEEIFSPLTRNNIPVLAVTGNHDLYGGSVPVELADLVRRLSLGIRPGSDGIVRLPGVEILPLEQTIPTPPFISAGFQKPGELMMAMSSWREPPDGAMRLACGHYPVIDFHPRDPLLFLRKLRGAENLEQFINRAGVAGYFCGHNHCRFETALAGGCRQYAAPPLSSPNAGEVAIYECGSGLERPILAGPQCK
ncbi:MAG: metallophosphoesterase [Planctomycetota bacterium]|jgi:hypothetical protein|nr:metallophosphoesterase [Planctomycetota bacterium]